MKRDELSWLAGWLEGEASFYYTEHGRNTRIIIQIFSTDIDVLQKAMGLMQTKSLTRIPPRECRGTQWKSNGGYRTEIQGEPAATLMRMLLPSMGIRRTEQITKALAKWEARFNKPIEKLCACGCGRLIFNGPRQIYARTETGACAMRAFRARKRESA